AKALRGNGQARGSPGTRGLAPGGPAVRARAIGLSPPPRARRHRTTSRSRLLPAAPSARRGETAANGGGERPRGPRRETSWRSCACQASRRLPRRALSDVAIAAFQSQCPPLAPQRPGRRLARDAAFFDITPHGPESRARDRRPLGVRLWLADVAAQPFVFPSPP